MTGSHFGALPAVKRWLATTLGQLPTGQEAPCVHLKRTWGGKAAEPSALRPAQRSRSTACPQLPSGGCVAGGSGSRGLRSWGQASQKGRCHVPRSIAGGQEGPQRRRGGGHPGASQTAIWHCCLAVWQPIALILSERGGDGWPLEMASQGTLGPPCPTHWVGGGGGRKRGPVGWWPQGRGAQGSPGLKDSDRSESRPRGYAAHPAEPSAGWVPLSGGWKRGLGPCYLGPRVFTAELFKPLFYRPWGTIWI